MRKTSPYNEKYFRQPTTKKERTKNEATAVSREQPYPLTEKFIQYSLHIKQYFVPLPSEKN